MTPSQRGGRRPAVAGRRPPLPPVVGVLVVALLAGLAVIALTRGRVLDRLPFVLREHCTLTLPSGSRDLDLAEAAQLTEALSRPAAAAQLSPALRPLVAELAAAGPAALTCAVRPPAVAPQAEGPTGLTPRAVGVRQALGSAFGRQSLGGFAPGGVTSGHTSHSAHYEGRAIDVFFRPVSAANNRRGWLVAQWAVAHAKQLRIATVIYDDRIWSAGHSAQGWRAYTPPEGPTDNPILRHLDHVHIDVLRG